MKVSEAIERLQSVLEEKGDIDVAYIEHYGTHWEMVTDLTIGPLAFGAPFNTIKAAIVRSDTVFPNEAKRSPLRIVKEKKS